MVTLEETKEKIKRYMEKLGLDLPSQYAVAKDLEDDLWDSWRNVGEDNNAMPEDFSEFDTPIQQATHLTTNQNIGQQQQNPVVPNLRRPDLPISVT